MLTKQCLRKALPPYSASPCGRGQGRGARARPAAPFPLKRGHHTAPFAYALRARTGFEAIRNKGFDWRSILAGNFAIFAIRAFATIASSLRAFTALTRLATTVFGSALRRPAFPTITTTTVWTAVSAAISTIASFTPVYAALTTTIRGALATTI